ncbi:hypothetical protein BH10PSE12_BH10PSE12_23230 [soil metagenome]
MSDTDDLPPLVPFLKRDGDTPYLAGSRCRKCDNLFVGDRATCARCGSRGEMDTVRLSETGKLYVHTVVYRSFPGVATPFIDAIVDLDDGAHLRGTLTGIDPDPDAIPYDLAVRVVYRAATPANRPGVPYLTYMFEPL